MEKATPPWTLAGLAGILEGEAAGPPDLALIRPVSAGDDDPRGVTFAENDTYLKKVEASGVGAVLIGPGMETAKPSIRVESPRIAFFKLLHLSVRPLAAQAGIHPTAVIDSSASVDPTASIGAFSMIGPGVVVGAGAIVHPHVFIGDRSRLGEQCLLYPHVTIYPDVEIGPRSIVHAGSVVGADGFGYVWDGQRRLKVPQVGGVRIGADVEIGANVCIDRATAGVTEIGDGAKIDNLVQIGHNGKIGRHVVIAGQCGISGSVTIGDRSVLGGGVGTTDHVSITHDVTLGGRSGVDRDIEEPGEYFGTPARPAREALRAFLLVPKLPELWSRLRKLEKRAGDE